MGVSFLQLAAKEPGNEEGCIGKRVDSVDGSQWCWQQWQISHGQQQQALGTVEVPAWRLISAAKTDLAEGEMAKVCWQLMPWAGRCSAALDSAVLQLKQCWCMGACSLSWYYC